MMKCLSKYVCKAFHEQIYMLYALEDYGVILCHKIDPEMYLHLTRKFLQTQCSAALAVTGALRSTRNQRLCEELG